MLSPQQKSEVTCICARAVTQARRVDRFPRIAYLVHHGACDLGVMAPRSAVEVVRPDRRPDVVDHADLGVHVNRNSKQVLDVEDRYAVPARLEESLNGLFPSDLVRRERHCASLVKIPGDHCNQVQLRVGSQSIDEWSHHVSRPEVLIFDVYEPAGATERFQVSARDAALAVRGKWITPRTAAVRAQHLDRLGSPRGRVRCDRWQSARLAVRPAKHVMEYPDGVATERASVRPPLAEREVQVSDSRSLDRHLDVMPWWGRSVQRRHRLALRVAEMPSIVAAAVTEVDPADKGDVGRSPCPMADDDE